MIQDILARLPPASAPPGGDGATALRRLIATHAEWRPLELREASPGAPLAAGDAAELAAGALLAHFSHEHAADLLAGRPATLLAPSGLQVGVTRVSSFDGITYTALATLDGEPAILVFSGNVPFCRAVYLPSRQLLVAASGMGPATLRTVALFDAVLALNPELALRHWEAPVRSVSVMVANQHIGHHLWDELSGIAALAERLGADAIGQVHVRPCPTELYHPVDELLPDLAGRVARPSSTEELLAGVLAGPAAVVPVTGRRIPAALCERIVALSVAQSRDLLARLDALDRPGSLRCLIGLRTENRCWRRQADGYVALAEQLLTWRSHVVLVMDGHNSHHDARHGVVKSFGEKRLVGTSEDAPATVLEEQRIVRTVVAALAERGLSDRVQVVSTVMDSVPASIAAADWCEVFVSHWGAGLAKYKWVCNKPGFVLTNRAMLEGGTYKARDLLIYDDPDIRPEICAGRFVDPALITDLPFPEGQLVPVKDPFASAFEIEPDAFAGAALATLRELAPG